MPIYEFRCPVCGERFERLVEAGTGSVACEECGAERTERILSAQAPSPRLVKSAGDRSKQEASNSRLRARTKAEFKARRSRARAARGKGDAR